MPMRLLLLAAPVALQVILVLLVGTAGAEEVAASGGTYLGGYLGIPQLVGIGLEAGLGHHLHLGLHAGSMFVINSFGARLIGCTTEEGLGFRYFGGIVAGHFWYGQDPDSPRSLSLHGWAGIGLGLDRDEWRFNLDVGGILSDEGSEGIGISGFFPAFSVGVMHRL